MDKKALVISSAVVLIVVAAASFYVGMNYGKGQNSKPSFNAANFQAMRGSKTGANGGNFISGNIISKDSSSITLQIPNNGGSKIIFYSDTTQINKSAAGTANDLTTGTTVSITGTTNSDGSVTAQSIQIRPANQNRLNQ